MPCLNYRPSYVTEYQEKTSHNKKTFLALANRVKID